MQSSECSAIAPCPVAVTAVCCGESIARRFSRDGFQVVIADVDDDRGTALAERIDGCFVRTDVSQPAMFPLKVEQAGLQPLLTHNEVEHAHLGACAHPHMHRRMHADARTDTQRHARTHTCTHACTGLK